MSQAVYHKGGSKKYVLDKVFTDKLHFAPDADIYSNYAIFYTDGTLVIDEAYEWDGPSGPAIDTDTFVDGSLVHDVLYQMMRELRLPRSYRWKADKEMRIQCTKDKMLWPRRWWTWLGVRIGGYWSAR